MKNNSILLVIVALVIGLAGGFFGGMKYQENKTSSFGNDFNRRFTQGPNGSQNGQIQRNRMGFRPVSGEIISADDKSITVKLQDGSSKIVLVNDKTTINKAEAAGKSDLKTGEKVAVFGTENSDGSVSAQNIQLNPISRGMTGGTPGQ